MKRFIYVLTLGGCIAIEGYFLRQFSLGASIAVFTAATLGFIAGATA